MNQEEHDETEKVIRGRLQEIGRIIQDELPIGWVYTMLFAPHADEDVKGVTLYLSTMQRPDALQIMREFLATQKEERHWMREVTTDTLSIEEFDQWWDAQINRGLESWDLKRACQEAWVGGKASN